MQFHGWTGCSSANAHLLGFKKLHTGVDVSERPEAHK